MDADLPKHINYWITTTSKHDCFFNVGSELESKERIGAIKVLLVAHSEVFQKMLDDSLLAELSDIPVTDSDPESFMNFIKCIYGGTDVVVKKLQYEKCLKLIYLCEKYLTLEMKEYISFLILQLHDPLTIDHVLTTLLNPACLVNPSDTLGKAISKVIQNQTEKILNHELFLDLDSIAVMFIVKQETISVKEVTLWLAVFKWAQKKVNSKDSKDLRSCLLNILKHIRFCTMESNEFCKFVVPSKVLTPEEVFEICYSIGTGNSPNDLGSMCCNILNRSQSITQKRKIVVDLEMDDRIGLPNCSNDHNRMSKTYRSERDKSWGRFQGGMRRGN